MGSNHSKIIVTSIKQQTSGINPSKRAEHTSVSYNGSMYVCMGRDGSKIHGDMFQYHFKRKKWLKVPFFKDAPSPRYGHTCVVYKNEMILFGGKGEEDELNDMYSFSFKSYKWKRIEQKGDIPCPRSQHSAIVIGDTMYVYGGAGYYPFGEDHYSSVYAFNIKEKKWGKLNCRGECPGERSGHVVAAYDKKMYVMGGMSESGFHNDIFEFDINSGTWKKLLTTGPSPSLLSVFHSAVQEENSHLMYTLGSLDDRCINFYQFDFTKSQWSKLQFKDSEQSPMPTVFHTCVMDGNEIILFGGENIMSVNNDLFRIFLPISIRPNHREDVDDYFLEEKSEDDLQQQPLQEKLISQM